MATETTDLDELLRGNPDLKQKVLGVLEEKGDDGNACFVLNSRLSDEEKEVLNLHEDRMMDDLGNLLAVVREQRNAEAAPIISGEASYERVLSLFASTKPDYTRKVMFLALAGGGKTFFVRTSDVTNFFRHEGAWAAIPPLVHVAKNYRNIVHVYNQHSGAGKTVELCCSAYIRGADLAIYHQSRVKDEIQAKAVKKVLSSKFPSFHNATEDDAEEMKKIARKIVAEEIVKKIVGEAVAWNNSVFLALRKHCMPSIKDLKLVLAIDEASNCRNLVRAIIRHYRELGETAATEFEKVLHWTGKIEVVFSVAGTGAAAQDIGSLPDNYTTVKPSIVKDPELVYEALRTGRSDRLPTYEELETMHPVLFTFVQHNARLCSIASKVLESDSDDTEGLLIRKVVDLFLKSSGMSDIADKPEELARAGAQTLAVHLFQEPPPKPQDEKEGRQLADSYDYGVALEGTTTLKQKGIMTQLVHKYGLVIALPFDNGVEGNKFSVDSAMQLLALFMMGLSSGIDLLESSSFGYEVLSTHLVKCSIASTLAIKEEKRPSIQEALKKVGFGLNELHAGMTSVRQFTDYALWHDMSQMTAVHGKYERQYRETRQHRQVMDTKKVKASQFPVMETNGVTRRKVDGNYLLVDRKLIGAIRGMKLCKADGCFWPPLASLAKGASPYADGYVSFLAKSKSAARPTLRTIMVQAKDYFSPNIDFKRVKENVDRCRCVELSTAFGESRLMSVASRYKKLVASRTCTHFRDFIMFSTDESSLLSDLMDTLDDQRNGVIIHHFTGGIQSVATAASAPAAGDDEEPQKKRKRSEHAV